MKSKPWYALEFAVVRALDLFLQALPRSWSNALGEGLGTLLSWFLPSRRRLVLKNLSLAFPEKPAAELKKIAAAVWRNLGRVAIEFVRLSEIRADTLAQHVEYVNPEMIRKAEAEGKGLILVGFHFTNWEATGLAADALVRNLVSIARPIKNPYIEKWVSQKRGSSSLETILHRNAVKGSLKALHQKKSVGVLVDQNLYKGGVFSDFFDRKAATTPLPAILHLRTGAPVFLCHSLREGNKFKLILERLDPEFPTTDSESSVQIVTDMINQRIEAIIRKYPEMWFWVHNRWKRQPLEHELAAH